MADRGIRWTRGQRVLHPLDRHIIRVVRGLVAWGEIPQTCSDTGLPVSDGRFASTSLVLELHIAGYGTLRLTLLYSTRSPQDNCRVTCTYKRPALH